MSLLFISCERVDSPHAATLIQKLREKGIIVSHSPCNPLDGIDERWCDWYARSGQAEIGKADIFVVIVTPGWDSSTWMSFEATEAFKGLQQGRIKRMFHYNPENVEVHHPENKQELLGQKLPANLEETVTVLELVRSE